MRYHIPRGLGVVGARNDGGNQKLQRGSKKLYPVKITDNKIGKTNGKVKGEGKAKRDGKQMKMRK